MLRRLSFDLSVDLPFYTYTTGITVTQFTYGVLNSGSWVRSITSSNKGVKYFSQYQNLTEYD